MRADQERLAGLGRSVDGLRRRALSGWGSPAARALLAECLARCATSTDVEAAEGRNRVDIALPDGTTVAVKRSSGSLQPGTGGKPVRTPPRFGMGRKGRERTNWALAAGTRCGQAVG